MSEHPIGPEDPASPSDDARRAERKRLFTRRRILEVGWTVPVIALTSQVAGQRDPGVSYPGPGHVDGGHLDYHVHADKVEGHADGDTVYHMDSHGEHWDDCGPNHEDETSTGFHHDGGHMDIGHHADYVSEHVDSNFPGHDDWDVKHWDGGVHGDFLHQDY